MFEVAKWALLVLMIVASIIWLGRVIVSTYYKIAQRTQENGNKGEEQTLGYPKGTVRTFLAIVITFIVAIIVVYASAGTFDSDVSKWATASYGAVIAFYFGSKVLEGKKNGSK